MIPRFLILKATSEAPAEVAEPEPVSQNAASVDVEKRDRWTESVQPLIEKIQEEIHLGMGERLEEARRYADLGKSMRLVDTERPHEAHLVGPDLADPHTWRHTLLVDDQPFSDAEFDHAEDAFMSALQTGAVPVAAPDQGPADFDLDRPFAPEE